MQQGLATSVAGAGAVSRWQLTAYLELTLAMTTVGGSAVLGKRMVEELPIYLAGALRFGLAALILVPLMLRAAGGLPQVSRRDIGTLFLQALTGVFGFTLFWLFGLRLTTAAEGGVVASTTPVLIAVASFLLLGERPRGREIVGVSLAVAGVAAMTLAAGEDGAGRGPNPLLGNALIVGAVAGEALFLVLGKRVGERVEPMVIATMVTLFGFALFLPLAINDLATTDLARVTGGAWLAVVLYALGPTVLGYILAYRGLARVPATTAGVFTGVVPISAIVFSSLFLGEAIGWGHLVGLAGVLAAIGLAVGTGASRDRG